MSQMTRTEIITHMCELAAGMEDAKQTIKAAEQKFDNLSIDLQNLLHKMQNEE